MMKKRSQRLIGGASTLLFLLGAGCAHVPSLYGQPGTSAAPQTPWVPPPPARVAPATPSTAPPLPTQLPPGADHLSLAQVVDIALRTSTQTRAAWASARAAAAAYGSKEGSWYPDVNLGANVSRQRSAPSNGVQAPEQRTYGGTADFSWMLFNFGGRRAAIDETRQALLAADWNHNAVIQNVVLAVEQAYYQYVTAKALLASEQSTLKEARANLDAANAQHQAGLATIADVLQAQTAVSQVRFSVAGLQGQISTTRGALATAMGLPADLDFDVEGLPETPPRQEAAVEVDRALEEAKANRPDLAAARAEAMQAEAHLRAVRAAQYPAFTAGGVGARTFPDNPDHPYSTYTATLGVRVPLFTGFSQQYDVQQSKAEVDLARAQLQSAEQAVILQVWTSYYDFKTAQERLAASDDLLKSASQAHDAVLGRYQAGVGSILDLMTAEAALEGARAQQVQARSDWYMFLAQFAHDTGTLAPTTPSAKENPQEEKKP